MLTVSPTVLIVDDDHGIRDVLGKFLEKHGYQAMLAKNGHEMAQALQAYSKIDLVILDVMMPGRDGMALCRELRSQSSIPIIMLTAMSEDVDRILGLELGADDYLSKPFNPRELLARIKAVLRRTQSVSDNELNGLNGCHDETAHRQNTTVTKKSLIDRYHFSGWILEKQTRRLLSPDAVEISLSAGEFNLLLVMLERAQNVLSRDQLLDLTKNRCAGPFDRSVDIQISRIRHKIEEDPKQPRIIKTVRGGGYVLATPVEVHH